LKFRIATAFVLFIAAGLFIFFFSFNRTPVPPPPVKNSKGLYYVGAISQISRKPGEEAPKEGLQKLTAYVVPEITQDELQEYAKDDRACKIENSIFSFNAAASVLIKAPDLLKVDADTDRILADVFNPVEAAKNSDAENITKFFNAVMLSDLFFGTDSPEVNYQKAHDLLEELKVSDPDNGAYDFINAYVLSKMQATGSEIQSEFNSGFHKKRADFYSDTIHRRLYEKAFAGPSYWLIYLKILGRLDEVNVSPVAFLLHDYLQNGDAEFNRAAVHFSRLLIPENVKEGASPSLNPWEKSYYMFGQKILTWAWPNAYPGQAMPDYKPIKFLLVVNMNSVGQGEEAFNHLTKSPSNFYTCKRDLFDIWFTQTKILEVNRRE
jgi:hypothetical protein